MHEYTHEFVLRVNEIYHDVAVKYRRTPPLGMLRQEKEHWENIGKNLIAGKKEDLCILDVGTGTGLVPLCLGKYLKKRDLFIASDISLESLDACRENIGKEEFDGTFRYLKAEGNNIELESGKCDLITMNSVLHHIRDYSAFFGEIDRLLRKGGCLVIGHEPNRRYFVNKFLWNNYKALTLILNPKQFCIDIAMRMGVFEPVRKFAGKFMEDVQNYNNIVDEVNRRLLEEELIPGNLMADTMTEIVDIWSPTAGGYHQDKGFEVREIREKYLPRFEVETSETYNHLGKASLGKGFARGYDAFLKKRYPKDGAQFFACFRKKE